MAIVKEKHSTTKDGVVLVRTYSDKGCYIVQEQTGIEYEDAVDRVNSPYTYAETDKPIIDIAEATGEKQSVGE